MNTAVAFNPESKNISKDRKPSLAAQPQLSPQFPILSSPREVIFCLVLADSHLHHKTITHRAPSYLTQCVLSLITKTAR